MVGYSQVLRAMRERTRVIRGAIGQVMEPGRITNGQKSHTQILEGGLLALAFVAVVLSRLPFQAQDVESFDAVNYILGIGHFDMRISQPQPPGYILYILIARLANLATREPHQALLLVSQVFSGLAVVAMYLAGRELFNRRVGAAGAALLATAPLFWFTGGGAVPYAPDLAFATCSAWLAYRAMRSTESSIAWAAAVSLGLAGAFRLQTLIFLFPLFVYATRKRPLRSFLAGIGVAGAVFAAFFLPSVMASGGVRASLEALRAIVPALNDTGVGTSLAQQALRHVVLTGRHTFAALGELLLPLVAAGLLLQLRHGRQNRERNLFLLLWIAPMWLVCLAIGPGNIGTIQVTTGVYFLLAATAVAWLMERPRGAWLGWAVLLLVMVAHTLMFTRMPYRPLGERYRVFYTYDTIRSTVRDYQQKIDMIRAYPSDQTVVVAREFRLVQYYLPDYLVFSAPTFDQHHPERFGSIVAVQHNRVVYLNSVSMESLLPPGTRYVIFFDRQLMRYPVEGAELQELRAGAVSVHVMEINPSAHLRWNAFGIRVIP